MLKKSKFFITTAILASIMSLMPIAEGRTTKMIALEKQSIPVNVPISDQQMKVLKLAQVRSNQQQNEKDNSMIIVVLIVVFAVIWILFYVKV